MMRNPGMVLETFVRYHQAIGFSDFVILFDDPADPDIERAKTLPGVIPVPVDHAVRKAWQRQRHYDQCKDHVDQTVGARQLLNIEYGFNVALQAGIDWLLHIDIDELLYIKSGDILGHAEALENSDKDIAVYHNFEAVPDGFDVDNYFTEVNLFKKPVAMLRAQKIDRSESWPAGRRYFNFYNNGKSLTRVSPGIYPLGAHRWAHENRELNKVIFFNPCVLHFSVCGYRYFEQKYRHRGNFSDVRINKDMRKNGAHLDLDARDAFIQDDFDGARQIYQDRVMMDKATQDKLIAAGVLKRFNLKRFLA